MIAGLIELRTMKPRTAADLLMLIVTLIWGMNFAIIKSAFSCFHPLAFTMLRFIGAAVVISAVLKLRGYPLAGERRDLPALAGLGIVSNTLYQILFVIGLDHTRAGNAGLLISSTPMFAYLSGVLLNKDPFRRRVLGGILLSAAGVAVVVLFSSKTVEFGSSWFGDTLILLSAICWGIYTGWAARWVLKYGPVRMTLWTMLTGTAAMLPPLLPFLLRQDWRAVTPEGWLGFLYSTFLAIVFGYLAWSYALRHLGVARTAIYSNVTPMIALFGGWLVLGERPVAAQLLGAALILGGVFLVRARGASLAPLLSRRREIPREGRG